APTAGVWALPFVYLYALQIYFDFSGYTDIARGLGLLFGFRWPDNFNLPYLAGSVQEFWQRWHMSLSQWLRDYLYIPLAGSRRGRWRTNINLMLTRLLGGLWHGASWTFLLWGGLHGLYLIFHKCWAATRLRAWLVRPGIVAACWQVVAVVLTFHAVCLAWIFFRLANLSDAVICVRKCLTFAPGRMLVGTGADPSLWCLLAGYGALAALLLGATRVAQRFEGFRVRPAWRGAAWGMAVALFLLAVLLTPVGQKTPFIYFQF